MSIKLNWKKPVTPQMESFVVGCCTDDGSRIVVERVSNYLRFDCYPDDTESHRPIVVEIEESEIPELQRVLAKFVKARF